MRMQNWAGKLLQCCFAALVMTGTTCYAAPSYSVTAIGSLGGTLTSVWGLNDAGQAAGNSSLHGEAVSHPYVYSGGVMTDIGTLGGAYAGAYAINNSGHVAGFSRVGSNESPVHGFLYSNGTMTDLGTLGGRESVGTSINNAGQVVGYSDVGGIASHGFLYENGVMRDLGTLGNWDSIARSINNAGQIVGDSHLSPDNPSAHIFVYNNGFMRDLGAYRGLNTVAQDINDAGHIVGYGVPVTGGLHSAFLYRDGVMVDLGQGVSARAIAINNAGQVVGSSGDGHAFLYSDGLMHDLNNLIDLQDTGGKFLSIATNINNNGQIVAMAWGPGPFGPSDAFLLTPRADAPEPPVSLLMFIGLIGLGLMQHHRGHTLKSRELA
jgi:probable HAF family extracellular repeat protein